MTESAPARPPFREAALRRLQSPDRIDLAVPVTDAKGWIAVAAGIVAVIGAVIWGFTGSVPDRVEASLVLIRPDAVVRLVADQAGTIATVERLPGTNVEPGDVLVTLSHADGSTSELITPRDGVVEQVLVPTGVEVAAGTVLVTVLDPDLADAIEGFAVVGPDEATELRTGQRATIQPSTVDAREHGQLLGQITYVAELPSSVDGIAAVVQNRALAEFLAESADGVPYLVRVEFDDPPAWTNGDAPEFRLRDGTLSEFSVTVDHDRPIELFFGG